MKREAILAACLKPFRPVIELVLDYIDAREPKSGKNTNVTDSPAGGKNIDSKASPASETVIADFALYDGSGNHAESGGLWMGVRFGCVTVYNAASGLLPWPSEYTSANGYAFEFQVSGNGSAWLEVQNSTSTAYYQATSIHVRRGATPDNPTDVNGVLVLGAWSVVDGVLKILSGEGANGVGNQFYDYCGYGHGWSKA